MLNYSSCKTNGQFFIWILSEYWIPDLQRACLTPGKAINISQESIHGSRSLQAGRNCKRINITKSVLMCDLHNALWIQEIGKF